MKMNIVVLASLVCLTALVWMAFRSQKNTSPVDSSPVARVSPLPAEAAPAQVQIVQVPVPVQEPAISPLPATVVTQIDSNGAMKHVAQPGETVTSLAGDLLGKDSKTNRDAIINANASLKTDPDNLVAGKTYRIPAASDISATPAGTPTATAASPTVTSPAVADAQANVVLKPQADSTGAVKPGTSVLKYTAVPGDTVGKMAAAFLGSDDQVHQDLIVSANPSLKADASHVEVGRAYRIPAPDGLSATVGTSPIEATARPASQTDADQIVAASAARTLKYTARDGDTLNKMAIKLLGSDTQENRDLILSKNAELRKNPDRVIAGQTYWIPAPDASADVR